MPIQLESPSAVISQRNASQTPEQLQQITRAIAQRIGSRKFDMWFAHAGLRLDGERLSVAADSPFAAKWIGSHFADSLKGIAEEVVGSAVTIDVHVAACPPPRNDQAPRRRSAPAPGSGAAPHGMNGRADTQRHLDVSKPETTADELVRTEVAGAARTRRTSTFRRLDDFIVGECNKLAFSTACRLAEDADARCISPLFIHGDCGVGKTHLLQGICQRFIQATGRSHQVRYVTGEQFTNEYITAIRTNAIDAFRQKIRKLDLLAIDDVHFLSNKVRTQTEFLYTLDAIDLSGARVVLASDNHPHHIKRFDRALVSRFLSGMVVKIDRPDRSTRIELIRRLAATRGLRLNEAAVDAIAGNCVGSVREIEGAITKLAACKALMNGDANGYNGNVNANGHSEGNGEIGLVLVEQLFKEQSWHGTNGARVIRLAAVIDAVCQRLGVGKSDLMGSGRHRRVVLARALVAYLSRELTTHSFPEIAQALGRANHSTIHTADQRLRRQIADNEPVERCGGDGSATLRELVDQLRRAVMDCNRH